MKRRNLLLAAGALALPMARAHAADAIKIGVVLPLTGPFALAGLQALQGMRTFFAISGTQVAGREVALVVRDDTGNPAVARRLTQELAINDQVSALAGYGLTPMAAAAAPIATQVKLPMLVTGAGAIKVPDMSPYAVRVFETLPQISAPLAQWALAQGIRRVVSLVADYAPGYDAEIGFKPAFERGQGKVLEMLRTPVDTADFSAYLQRAKDAAPDALFVFQPEGPGGVLMRQFHDRQLLAAGIRFLGAGDIVPEDIIANGDASFCLGTNSAQAYASNRMSPENAAFRAQYEKISKGVAPDIQSVAGFDAMHLITTALRKAGPTADGTALLDAMRGESWISPRGQVTIDATTRDLTQDVYVREFRSVGGKVVNEVIATYQGVAPDPV